MVLEGYGIRLTRLVEEDIEMLRQWRNSSHINRFMEFREEISREQQKSWFDSINNIHNNYFIIEAEGEQIGLINGAGINWETKETESAGIFIWDEEYWRTIVPISASMLLADTSVLLGLEKTYIKILKENKNAISFNKMLGYEHLPKLDQPLTQFYVLTRINYIKKRDQLRKLVFKQSDRFELHITFHEVDSEVSKFYVDKLSTLPAAMKSEFTLKTP